MPMGNRMRNRLLLLLVPTALGAAADAAFKAASTTPPEAFHARSHAWVGLSLALLAGALALAFVPSNIVAVGAGLAAGGILGNLVSAAEHGGRVPDPIAVHELAFNLADVLLLAGIAVLVPALAAVSVRKRERLIPPRRWERAAAVRLRRIASAAGSRRGTRSSR
jgi:hypothetical protein